MTVMGHQNLIGSVTRTSSSVNLLSSLVKSSSFTSECTSIVWLAGSALPQTATANCSQVVSPNKVKGVEGQQGNIFET